MIGGKGIFIVTLVTGVISAAAAVVSCVDNVVNGNKRAVLQGTATGQAYAYAQEEIRKCKEEGYNGQTEREPEPLM